MKKVIKNLMLVSLVASSSLSYSMLRRTVLPCGISQAASHMVTVPESVVSQRSASDSNQNYSKFFTKVCNMNMGSIVPDKVQKRWNMLHVEQKKLVKRVFAGSCLLFPHDPFLASTFSVGTFLMLQAIKLRSNIALEYKYFKKSLSIEKVIADASYQFEKSSRESNSSQLKFEEFVNVRDNLFDDIDRKINQNSMIIAMTYYTFPDKFVDFNQDNLKEGIKYFTEFLDQFDSILLELQEVDSLPIDKKEAVLAVQRLKDRAQDIIKKLERLIEDLDKLK